MSVQTGDQNRVLVHVRPMLERLDRATGSDPFASSSFHRLCTSLGIAHSLRPDLWRTLVVQGLVTDAGNGEIGLAEGGLRLVAASRRRR